MTKLTSEHPFGPGQARSEFNVTPKTVTRWAEAGRPDPLPCVRPGLAVASS